MSKKRIDNSPPTQLLEAEVGDCFSFYAFGDSPVLIEILSIDRDNCEVEFGIDLPPGASIHVGDAPRECCGYPSCRGAARFALFWSFLLFKKTRENLFLPAFNELLEDYSFAKKKFRKRSHRFLLSAIFLFKTALTISKCIWLDAGSTIRMLITITVVRWIRLGG